MTNALIWQADFGPGPKDAGQAKFASVQFQSYNSLNKDDYGSISRPAAASYPLVDGPDGIGRALKLELNDLGRRLELLPPAPQREAGEGEVRFYRFDVWFDQSFPLQNTSGWGPIISQVHQHSDSSSPPIELQARRGFLIFSGGNNENNKPRCEGVPLLAVETGQLYKIVIGVTFSAVYGTPLAEVWVDDDQKMKAKLPWKTISPASTKSYWKGASFYTGPGNGGVMYQLNHRVGTTRQDVS